MNAFHHMRLPRGQVQGRRAPYFDTLYSMAWIDLAQGPVVMFAPETHGRYYMLPLMDIWTDVFAAPGTRRSGAEAGNFAVVPPGWQGTLPAGMEKIDAPTPYL